MTNAPIRILASLAICAALTTGTALARNNDHDRGKAGGSHHNATRDHDRVRDRDRDRDRDRRDWRERREARERQWRERREARAREWRREHRQNAMLGNNAQPHGWTQGRKTGWKDCNVPPGQAKKVGCTPATWHSTHRRPISSRDRDRD
jgi:hypothetical protein